MLAKGLAILSAVLLGSLPNETFAQVRASEPATVAQTVNGTSFRVEYFRPKVRGRNPLFGKEVPWDRLWTPGANWATTFEINRDVTIDGHAVAKGKYSVWFVVRPVVWTIVLDPRHNRYHEERPDSTGAQIRWTVEPQQGAFTEALTWSFPDVTPEGLALEFAWENRRVALGVVVPSKY